MIHSRNILSLLLAVFTAMSVLSFDSVFSADAMAVNNRITWQARGDIKTITNARDLLKILKGHRMTDGQTISFKKLETQVEAKNGYTTGKNKAQNQADWCNRLNLLANNLQINLSTGTKKRPRQEEGQPPAAPDAAPPVQEEPHAAVENQQPEENPEPRAKRHKVEEIVEIIQQAAAPAVERMETISPRILAVFAGTVAVCYCACNLENMTTTINHLPFLIRAVPAYSLVGFSVRPLRQLVRAIHIPRVFAVAEPAAE
jgi:hypothetical protein